MNGSYYQTPVFLNEFERDTTEGMNYNMEQSYIENILRNNIGKKVRVHASFSDSIEWRDRVFVGIIERAGRDNLIINDIPNISLGTVYRNLNLLADIGEAIKITTPEGGDRFDGNTDPHYHVVCTACGKVDDLHLDQEQIEAVNKLGNSHYSGSIKTHTTLFYGNCSECCSK